jgi:hypothetical protein
MYFRMFESRRVLMTCLSYALRLRLLPVRLCLYVLHPSVWARWRLLQRTWICIYIYIYIFRPTFFADLFRYILTDRSISLSSYVAILYARVIVSFCVRWKSRHISVDTSSLTIHGGWLVVLKEYFFLCMLTCVSSPSNGSMHFKHTQSQRPSMRLGTTFPSSHI